MKKILFIAMFLVFVGCESVEECWKRCINEGNYESVCMDQCGASEL